MCRVLLREARELSVCRPCTASIWGPRPSLLCALLYVIVLSLYGLWCEWQCCVVLCLFVQSARAMTQSPLCRERISLCWMEVLNTVNYLR